MLTFYTPPSSYSLWDFTKEPEKPSCSYNGFCMEKSLFLRNEIPWMAQDIGTPPTVWQKRGFLKTNTPSIPVQFHPVNLKPRVTPLQSIENRENFEIPPFSKLHRVNEDGYMNRGSKNLPNPFRGA